MKNLANVGHPKKSLKKVLKKRGGFLKKAFLKKVIINCFFSFGSQLQLNCQQIRCLHEISFLFLDDQKNRMMYLPIKIDGIGKI